MFKWLDNLPIVPKLILVIALVYVLSLAIESVADYIRGEFGEEKEKKSFIGIYYEDAESPRGEIISAFEDRYYDFEEGEKINGKENIIGTSHSEEAYLQILGPEEKVSNANLLFSIDGAEEIVEENIESAHLLLEVVAEDWQEREDFIDDNLERVYEEQEVVTESYNNNEISLEWEDEGNFIFLQIDLQHNAP